MGALRKILYKICIVGDGGVGKTTILYQYVDGKFVEDTQLTIGTNFFIKDIILKEFDVSIKLQIWDLGGQIILLRSARVFITERGELFMCLI